MSFFGNRSSKRWKLLLLSSLKYISFKDYDFKIFFGKLDLLVGYGCVVSSFTDGF